MIFSSLTFLFVYLPLTLTVYFLAPLKWRNFVLLLVSLFFYGWGEPVYIVIMFLSILIDYTHGLLVEKYRENDKKARWFVAQSVAFWREFLPEVPEHMTIALDNVMDPGPDMLAQIMAQGDEPRLGVCLDVGHANTTVSSTAVPDWIGPLAPWLRHVHLHNNSGGWDLHDPLGEGNIPMEQVLDTLLARCPAATYTIENMNCAPSLDWLAARGYLGEITR